MEVESLQWFGCSYRLQPMVMHWQPGQEDGEARNAATLPPSWAPGGAEAGAFISTLLIIQSSVQVAVDAVSVCLLAVALVCG